MPSEMRWFMVYAAERRLQPGVVHQGPAETRPLSLVWENGAVGVFQATDATRACHAAARKHGRAGTYFAVEGTPWGLEMQPVEDVAELGAGDLFERPALGAGDGE